MYITRLSYKNAYDCMNTHTHTLSSSLDFVRDNPGEPVPEETLTHSHLSWSSIIPYLLSLSFTIHGILPVQLTCLIVFFHIYVQVFFALPLDLASSTSYRPYISSPDHCLLFAVHADTIATCFAVVIESCTGTGICSHPNHPHLHSTSFVPTYRHPIPNHPRYFILQKLTQ